ncbi:MAG TPA: molybdopterin-dependent oxidoreductase Mo/Fe-S-binding subunit [Candidatus Rifleibacterium sp.]|nr:molybdopterin-dependent oxidoreductase Mo/Fe-S-binding subunit [Candidatus Rifleibacterium sp.]
MSISINLNGSPFILEAEAGENLRDALRRAGILSVRNGCDGEGTCGNCSILVDGRLMNTCLLVVGQVEGRNLRTVEGLAKPRELTSLQTAFIDAGIVQCGYCTGSMLMAAAELLEKAECPTREQVKDALSGVFCRCTGYEQVFDAMNLAVARRKDPATPVEAPKFREGMRYVGSAKGKIDGYLLARGESAFVEDRVRPGHCHLKVMPSPHAHAFIKSIDTPKAEALKGVVAVFTYKNSPDVWYNPAGQGFPEPSPYDRRMFDQKLRHVGDRVAAVVAETPEIAAEALKLIKVEYEVLPAVLTIDEAKRPGAPVIHKAKVEYVVGAPADLDKYNQGVDPREGKIIYQFPIHADPHRNLAASVHGGIGDINKGFAEADVTIERTYESSQVQCTPLEPHIIYSRMEGDRLVLHASTQVPSHVRRIIARILSVKENKIRVIKERVGGGFGAKQDMVLEEVAAWATWVTGRDVLYRYTREEEFINSRTRHVIKVKVKVGAKKDGRLTAIHMDLEANTGPYGSHCLTVPMNACSKSLPLFLCDNVRFDVNTYYSNIAPTGAYQGYGAPQGSFAMQLAAAEMARELGMDPLEFIEKNRVREGVVLEILRCLGEGREGTPQLVYTCGLGPALEQGKKMINWGVKTSSDNPDVKIGQGVVILQQGSGLPGLDSANAAITQFGDGTFMILSGGTDLGTGLETVAVKLVAETLLIPMENVAVLAADTDSTPFDVGAYASSGTYFSGGAALNAALKMKDMLIKEAADILQEPENNLKLAWPGVVKGLSGEVTYEQIARRTQSGTGHGQLISTAHFITDKGSFPYGAHFCEVAVDTRTGKVRILKYYALQDAGTPINPELALGQIYGGVLKTIGHSLYEEMIYDEKGNCLNPNFVDYKVPQMGDLPDDFKAVLVDTNDPFGPMGAKSISEIACNGAAPVIAAAIHDACGAWIRSWPFTPEKILRALGSVK